MPARSLILLLVAWEFCAADEVSTIRQRERELAQALNSKNTSVLADLTGRDFKQYWSCGASVQNFDTSEQREDWFDDLKRLRIVAYQPSITKVKIQRDLATISLDESWTIQSPQKRQIERHFQTFDSWLKQGGSWKLVGRSSSCASAKP